MLFKIVYKVINSEAIVCHVVLSNELCHGASDSPPDHCSLLAWDISDHALGLPLSVSFFALRSATVNATILEGLSWAVPVRLHSYDSQIMVRKDTHCSL